MAELRSFVVVSPATVVDVPTVELRDGFVYVTLPPRPAAVRSSFELKLGGPEALLFAEDLARAAMQIAEVVTNEAGDVVGASSWRSPPSFR